MKTFGSERGVVEFFYLGVKSYCESSKRSSWIENFFKRKKSSKTETRWYDGSLLENEIWTEQNLCFLQVRCT